MGSGSEREQLEALRDQIVESLQRELIGPDPVTSVPGLVQTNGEEILVSEPPHLRYGAGVLFPQATATDPEEQGVDVGSADLSLASGDANASTDVEGIEEGRNGRGDMTIEDEAIPLANAYLPSAVGISFLADIPEAGLRITVEAASYRSERIKALTREGKEYTQQRHLRHPLKAVIAIPKKDILDGAEPGRVLLHRYPVAHQGENGDHLEVHLLSRPATGELGVRLLTISLVNTFVNDGTGSRSEQCYFQTRLSVEADSEAGTDDGFVREYSEPVRHDDPEAESLALLYRHRQTFAIGHGCAGAWQVSPTNRAKAIRVWSDAVPVHEIKPIVPTQFDDLILRMQDLADAEKAAMLLTRLCDRYDDWIKAQEQQTRNGDFPDRHQSAAHRHLDACKEALRRMRGGLALLRQDSQVRTAFCQANEAMLLQQVHYALPLRSWEWDAKQKALAITPGDNPDPQNPPKGKGTWYPFQIAFVLMNLKSLANPEDSERDLVDLIWFPTGGGKTEAYLGLTAFTILLRRIRRPNDTGTAILMRYTLRLLTAQQFERAAALICALEYLRQQGKIAGTRISIGLWAGGDLTPNRRSDSAMDNPGAVQWLNRLSQNRSNDNPFLVLKCPWCGAGMGQYDAGNGVQVRGYERSLAPQTMWFRCSDPACYFHSKEGERAKGMPLCVVDEDLYESPPTLLLGTVDKFALLPWKPEARAFFGLTGGSNQPPDLIIQDELHLISGPLGSMVGHYETVLQEMCRRSTSDGRRIGAKVVASTATISRAAEQCHALYDCRPEQVVLFPPQALRAGDSFFAYEDESRAGRLYVGVMATALKSHVTAQVRVMASLLQAPLEIEVTDERNRDPYWTLIGYFNSLRELGHAATLIQADIKEYLNAMWGRRGIRKPSDEKERDRRRFVNRFQELTSRIPSGQIPRKLQKLFHKYSPQEGVSERPVDACFATNMIGVGVDVPRLSLMTVVGQPKTTSDYIQATSRVGRAHPGLVVTVYNPSKPRDRSHYEHFYSYHQSIYRHVEPTSVTPFATPVRERALHALIATLVRYERTGEFRERPSPAPSDTLFAEIEQIIGKRVEHVDPEEHDGTLELFDYLREHWKLILPARYGDFNPRADGLPLMYPAGSEPKPDWEGRPWVTPSSMRAVDADCDARVLPRYPVPARSSDEENTTTQSQVTTNSPVSTPEGN